MKKKLLLLLALFPLWGIYGLYAQKEFWGTTHGQQDTPFYGTIYKTDFNGQNPVNIHSFDSLKGKQPDAPLFLASNGKLYGTTTRGGFYLNPDYSGGVLYEYDLILDKFKVVNFFGDTSNPNLRNPLYSGVIELAAGTLTGAIDYNGTYKYNMTNGVTSIAAIVPSFTSQNLIIRNELTGELTKGSDGFIYATTRHFSAAPNASPYMGAIAKINPTSNALNLVYPFAASYAQGAYPSGGLIEAVPNKFYGTTYYGGVNFEPNHQPTGAGVLFEYNATTNTYTKKIDFDYFSIGSFPSPLIKGSNGKLYGCTGGGGVNPDDGNIYNGNLFEYDASSNTFTILHHFTNELGPGHKLLIASDGNFFGANSAGIFKFDPISNTVTQTCIFDYDTFGSFGSSSSLIEICRKPRYHFFDTDTFDACAGETFTYDIQNTNATTYQWIKGNTNVPGQTTGILNLTSLTTADAGDYTCVMTNECGTTTTMPLHLTINCLGVNTNANLEQAVKLYPNPASDWVNIELPQNIDIAITSCALTNLLGQTVSRTATNHKIDVSELQQGIYIVSLQTNYGKWNGKFVKK